MSARRHDEKEDLKITITDPEYDTKKVMRLPSATIPSTRRPGEFIPWLLRKFDPSGAVCAATHQLIVLDENGKETRKVLWNRGQLRNGQKLQLRSLDSEKSILAPGPIHPEQFRTAAKRIAGLVAKQPKVEQPRPSKREEIVPLPTKKREEREPTRRGLHDDDDEGLLKATNLSSTNVVTSIDDAVERSPQRELANNSEAKSFSFTRIAEPKEVHFSQLPKGIQRDLLCAVLRVVGRASRRKQEGTESKVRAALMKQLSHIGNVPPGIFPPHILKEAWMRGMITLCDPRQRPHQLILTRDFAPIPREQPFTPEDVIDACLSVLASQTPRGQSCSWFSSKKAKEDEDDHEVVIEVPVKEVHKAMIATHMFPSVDIKKITGVDGKYTMSKSATSEILDCVRLVLKIVRTSRKEVKKENLVNRMRFSTETKSPQLATRPSVVESLIEWSIARRLIKIGPNGIITPSKWLSHLKKDLSANPTVIDFRRAKEFSMVLTPQVLATLLREHGSQLNASEGLPMKNAFTTFTAQCFDAVAHEKAHHSSSGQPPAPSAIDEKITSPEDLAPTFCLCITTLHRLGLLRIQDNPTKNNANPRCHIVKQFPNDDRYIPISEDDGPNANDLHPFFDDDQLTIHVVEAATIGDCNCALNESLVDGNCVDDAASLMPSIESSEKTTFLFTYEFSIKLLLVGRKLSRVITAKMGANASPSAAAPPGVTADWVKVRTKWLMMLHPDKASQSSQRRPVASRLSTFRKKEYNGFLHCLEASGLISWNPRESRFQVVDGLFDAMYYTFLLRLPAALAAVEAYKREHRSSGDPPIMMNLIKNSLNAQEDLGIQGATFDMSLCYFFLGRSKADAYTTEAYATNGNLRSIQIIENASGKKTQTLYTRLETFAKEETITALIYDSSMLQQQRRKAAQDKQGGSVSGGGDENGALDDCKLGVEEDATPYYWLLVPCGIAKSQLGRELNAIGPTKHERNPEDQIVHNRANDNSALNPVKGEAESDSDKAKDDPPPLADEDDDVSRVPCDTEGDDHTIINQQAPSIQNDEREVKEKELLAAQDDDGAEEEEEFCDGDEI